MSFPGACTVPGFSSLGSFRSRESRRAALSHPSGGYPGACSSEYSFGIGQVLLFVPLLLLILSGIAGMAWRILYGWRPSTVGWLWRVARWWIFGPFRPRLYERTGHDHTDTDTDTTSNDLISRACSLVGFILPSKVASSNDYTSPDYDQSRRRC